MAQDVQLAERAADGTIMAGEVILPEGGGAIIDRWL
jgi:hypothetical protein